MFNKFDLFIGLPVGISFLFSNYIWFLLDDKLLAIYVGIWMVSLVGMGVYLKLVRIRRLVLQNLQKDIKRIRNNTKVSSSNKNKTS